MLSTPPLLASQLVPTLAAGSDPEGLLRSTSPNPRCFANETQRGDMSCTISQSKSNGKGRPINPGLGVVLSVLASKQISLSYLLL